MKPPDLSFSSLDFSTTPFLVIWEMTQACDLVCRHCRASAIPDRCAEELTTLEGKRLLDAVHAMGTPVVVLSGGGPLKRSDLSELVAYGAELGLRMATIPAQLAGGMFPPLHSVERQKGSMPQRGFVLYPTREIYIQAVFSRYLPVTFAFRRLPLFIKIARSSNASETQTSSKDVAVDAAIETFAVAHDLVHMHLQEICSLKIPPVYTNLNVQSVEKTNYMPKWI